VLDDDGETRWWPVEVNGAAGWISGFFLVESGETPEGDVADQPATTTFTANSFVAVDTIEDAGANVRADAAPSGRDIGSLREGDVVRVVEGPASFVNSANGWYLITSGQLTGYVDGDLLTFADAPAAAADDIEVAGEFADGDYVAATTRSGVGVNVREGASRLTSRVGFVPEAGIVQITDGPEYDEDGDPWYRVTDGELSGWIAANLLEASAAPPLEEESEEEESAEPEPAPAGPTGGLVYPVDGRITQNFGCSDLGYYEFDPDFGCAVHDGLDIAAPSYTPIVAADGGTVTFAGLCDCGLGYYVEIDHGNGITTQYGHMAEQPYVATGEQVSQGETIGPVGSSGIATGPHVHFVVKVDGVAQDPLNFLP
ncbi:MAG: peptidoglycan DD-metalloendopeptidase family protein, partial [Chloroflexota bacterium]|nr:peptidoglycan DD-metalloendopeptidase family protein [Chloroflexota bacterium]